MSDFQLTTPVAFIIFNRPDTTKRVFEEIRRAKPPKLLVVADGPRFPEEAERCEEARAIIQRVDWDCEILTNFSETNLGCKRRISSGLDWVFDVVEEAIVLEDDCLPHPTFFRFCEELLGRYQDDERIMMISGTNFLSKWKSDIQSYHFSYYGGIWGWASWRRAWNYFDINMKLWPEPEVKNRIRDVLSDPEQYRWRERLFDRTYCGKIDTWDYQWSFARLSQSGLSIVPSVNLISNIGFGEDATHTSNLADNKANLPLYSMSFPLREPYGVAVDREYDRKLYLRLNSRANFIQRILNKVRRLLTG